MMAWKARQQETRPLQRERNKQVQQPNTLQRENQVQIKILSSRVEYSQHTLFYRPRGEGGSLSTFKKKKTVSHFFSKPASHYPLGGSATHVDHFLGHPKTEHMQNPRHPQNTPQYSKMPQNTPKNAFQAEKKMSSRPKKCGSTQQKVSFHFFSRGACGAGRP